MKTRRFTPALPMFCLVLAWGSEAASGDINASPADYKAALSSLQPGDTLHAASQGDANDRIEKRQRGFLCTQGANEPELVNGRELRSPGRSVRERSPQFDPFEPYSERN